MRKILLKEDQKNIIQFDDVNEEIDPIFAKKNGILRGMIVREDRGWMLSLGGRNASNGYHNNLWDCLNSCETYGYEFVVN